MSKILALDTSTESCSAALLLEEVLLERSESIPRQHAQRILPMIKELMSSADMDFRELDAVAFGRGPGSFTGLRIAAGVAQGIAYGADKPLIPVSTLKALALQAATRHACRFVLPLLDARISEIYWAAYEVCDAKVSILTADSLDPPAQLSLSADLSDKDWFVAGNGWCYADQLPLELKARVCGIDESLLPQASAIAKLARVDFQAGKVEDPAQISPLYLRDKVTQN